MGESESGGGRKEEQERRREGRGGKGRKGKTVQWYMLWFLITFPRPAARLPLPMSPQHTRSLLLHTLLRPPKAPKTHSRKGQGSGV
jgi:hypothetical protein